MIVYDLSTIIEEAEKRSKSLYDPHTAYQSINYSYNDSTSSAKSYSDMGKEDGNEESPEELYTKYCQYYGYDENDKAVKKYFEGMMRTLI